MSRLRPKAFYPEKRLIVFAGAMPGFRAHALSKRRVEALMFSYEIFSKQKPGKQGISEKYRDLYDSWPHYRYLDSGVFWLLRKGDRSRMNNNAQPRVRKGAEWRPSSFGGVVPESLIRERFGSYYHYLEVTLDDWDFVINFDIDQLDIEREDGVIIPGTVIADRCTEKLKALCGGKLIPVWHKGADDLKQSRWDWLTRDFKYVALGSDVPLSHRGFRYACDLAHDRGVLVHGLGVGIGIRADRKPDPVPFDTRDTSEWLAGLMYGSFAGISYGRKAGSYGAPQAWLENIARENGIDPELLARPEWKGEVGIAKCEIGIVLFQMRQAEMGAVPKSISVQMLPIRN
jgi:hypothetical protein